MKWFLATIWVLTVGAAIGVGYQLADRSSGSMPPPSAARGVQGRISNALRDRDVLTRTYYFAEALQDLDADNIGAAVAVFEAQRVGVTEGEVRLFMLAWCRFDPNGALAWASAWPGRWRSTLERVAIYAWAFRDPRGALDAMSTMEGVRRQGLRQSLVSGWARSGDTAGLTDYLFSRPASSERSKFVGMLLAELIQKGPRAVRNWAESVPADAPHQAQATAFRLAAGNLAQSDPSHASALFEAHQEFEYAQPALETIARRWVDYHDPLELFAWLFGLPASEARSHAVSAGFSQWWDASPRGARAWLQAEPPSEALDPALAVFARQESRASAARAIEWADRIHDEALRRRTMTPILRQWGRRDRAAALAWMNAHSVPKDVQREILNPTETMGAEFSTLGTGSQ